MKIAYFDCLAGAAGDMVLGALVSAGVPLEGLRERLSSLNLEQEFELRAESVRKAGLTATRVAVALTAAESAAPPPDRHLEEIEALVRKSTLSTQIQNAALGMFRRLAEVESGIHGEPVEKVHLHELGGVDTIVDIVGALVGLEALGVERAFASPLPLGRGFTKSAHGPIPLPAPATLALLKGIPVRGSDIEEELVTPTGALILTSVCQRFGPIPAMTLVGVGYGAGGRDLPIPNVLRLLVGETGDGNESLVLLETNVDDDTAEINGYAMERLLAAGALDVFFTPIQMKKNRPATMISVLSRLGDVEPLEAVLFQETTTLGVRRLPVERRCLERDTEIVQTHYGPLRVTVARLPDGTIKRAPEYEDCKKAAAAHGVPLRTIYEEVLRRSA